MLPSRYTAIYIDTESSFRPERIKAIARARGLDHEKILQRILVAKALEALCKNRAYGKQVLTLTLKQTRFPAK
jgi:RecA/RadA recombinase